MLCEALNTANIYEDDHTHFRSPSMKKLRESCIEQFKKVLKDVEQRDQKDAERDTKLELERPWEKTHKHSQKRKSRESIVDLLANNLFIGRYLMGQLLLEVHSVHHYLYNLLKLCSW